MKAQESPVIFVPFGATGDLMRTKVLPALYELFKTGGLPKQFRVIGFSHRAMDTAGFRAHVREMTGGDAAFLELFDFIQGEFDEARAYTSLAEAIVAREHEWGVPTAKFFYFSVAPKFYGQIAAALKSAGLSGEQDAAWTRVVIEKPFGTDGKSAEILEEALSAIFTERQIYRIDHYLAKDAIDEILALKSKQTLNKDSVESIHIELLEEIGVEKRGAFYDPLGTFRDVGQNHILETLAFLTMEAPLKGAEAMRRARAQALEALPILSDAQIAAQTFRAQHEGYRTIENVNPDSKTETYYKIVLTLASPEWQGVKVVMESGKRLGPQRKNIIITMQGGKQIVINLESKTKYTGEYIRLLAQAFAGDQTRFISREEVAAMWRFSDPILEVWHGGRPSLHTYTPDTKTIVEKARVIELP